MSGDFSPEQKRYLEGFTSGLQIARAGRGWRRQARGAARRRVPTPSICSRRTATSRAAASSTSRRSSSASSIRSTPIRGCKEQAANNESPKPADNFRWRYYGLFYVAPAQNSYMCRLRIPNGILTHWQLAGLADLAERFGGGYSHVTTRANLQIREIEPKNAVDVLEGDPGPRPLLARLRRRQHPQRHRHADRRHRPAGADRHPALRARLALSTSSTSARSTACRASSTSPSTAPARSPVLEDTNDIGFQAVEVKDGFGVEPGVWFRLALGGITGHRDFARDTGVIVKPADATKVADAIVRVFIDHGDRTNRNKARMKYVLDAMGFEKYLALVEEKLGCEAHRAFPPRRSRRARRFDRTAHIGVHRAEAGRACTGSASCCRSASSPPRRCAASPPSRSRFGDGDIRLTVWQNLLISGVPDRASSRLAEAAIEKLGLTDQGELDPRRASSPAPAMPAAGSPPPTPSATPRRSRAGARRASSSTGR